MDKRMMLGIVMLFALSSAFATQNLTISTGAYTTVNSSVYGASTLGNAGGINVTSIVTTDGTKQMYYTYPATGTRNIFTVYDGGAGASVFVVGNKRISTVSTGCLYRETFVDTWYSNITYTDKFYMNERFGTDGGTEFNGDTTIAGISIADAWKKTNYSTMFSNDTAFTSAGAVTDLLGQPELNEWILHDWSIGGKGISTCILINKTFAGFNATSLGTAIAGWDEMVYREVTGAGANHLLTTYYFPMNETGITARNKCIRYFDAVNSSDTVLSAILGTVSQRTGFLIDAVADANNDTEFTMNNPYGVAVITAKFPSDMAGDTIAFFNGSAQYSTYTNESGGWTCSGASQNCNNTGIYVDAGTKIAYAVWNYQPSGALETLKITDDSTTISVVLNTPLNATYYNNSQQYSFTLTTTVVAGATCYLNGTSIGNVLHGVTTTGYIYGAFGSNWLNISCMNGTTSGEDTVWFKINDFMNTSYAHNKTTAFEITNNTFGIGFDYNPYIMSNIECAYDYNNTARGNLSDSVVGLILNRSSTLITPLTIVNNTPHKISYNCTAKYLNGSISYKNYTDISQNLIWAYNITDITSSKNPANVGDSVTYTINGMEWATLANTVYTIQWNKTDYTPTGSGATHSSTIVMPIVNGYNASANVYGVLNVTYGGLVRNTTAPVLSQTIIKPSVVNCTLFPDDDFTSLNITGYNEVNRSIIVFDAEANFTVSTGAGIYSNSFLLENTTSYVLCLYPATTTTTFNSTIAYHSTGYTDRFYYHYNAELSNTTTRYDSLYLLETSLSDDILFTVTDESGNVYSPATVVLERFDPYFGFYTVAMGAVDGNGQVRIYAQAPEALYRKVILREGVEVYRSTSGEQISGSTVTIKVVTGDILYIYINNYAYSYSQRINETNRYWYFALSSIATGDTQSRFYVTKKTYVGTEVVCDLTNTSIGIEYTCPLGANLTGNTYTARGYVRDTNGQWHLVFTNSTSFRSAVNYAENGLFIAIAFIPTIIFMFSGAELMGIIAIIAVVVLSYFQLINDTLLITGLVVMFGIGVAVLIKRKVYP